MIDVVFVVLPDTLLLDLAGPAEAFRVANQQLAGRSRPPAFRLRHVGPAAQAGTSVGATLAGIEPLPARLEAGATWVVLLGQPSGRESALAEPLPAHWAATRRWLAEAVAPRLGDGVELITVCAGALLAADAGLLAGRRCTTHHEMLDELRRIAPTAQVLANRLFVVDGPVATSAGVTAGIDLALHAVARVCGDAVAAAVAQTMVVFHRRGSEDPQRSPLLAGRDHLHPALHRVQDAVLERPADAWPLKRLAEVAHVSPRHLTRLFAEHVGSSPREWIEAVRVALAERALREGRATKQAAADAGFGGARQWRRVRARGGTTGSRSRRTKARRGLTGPATTRRRRPRSTTLQAPCRRLAPPGSVQPGLGHPGRVPTGDAPQARRYDAPMTRRLALPALLLAAVSAFAQPGASPLPKPLQAPPASRGELLYENHCVACHTTQMHWRDQRIATDWFTLKAPVRRWQDAAHLKWSDEEIEDVARHLDERFYRFGSPPRS